MPSHQRYPDWMYESHKQAIKTLRSGRANTDYLRDKIPGSTEDTLAELEENEYIEELDNSNLYTLIDDPVDAESWFHLICNTCRTRTEITLPTQKVTNNIHEDMHNRCNECNEITLHTFTAVSPP